MQIGCTRVNWSNWLWPSGDARPRSDALQAPTSAACSHSRANRYAFPPRRAALVCGSLAVAPRRIGPFDATFDTIATRCPDPGKFPVTGVKRGEEGELRSKERPRTRLNVKLHELQPSFSKYLGIYSWQDGKRIRRNSRVLSLLRVVFTSNGNNYFREWTTFSDR